MVRKLSSNKVILIGFGLLAIIGLIIVSSNATKNAAPSPIPSPEVPNPKAASMPSPTQDKPVEGQIIVQFNSHYTDAQINAYLQQYHASIIKHIEGINQTVVKVPAGQEDTISQQIKNSPYVQQVQRDYTTHAFFAPNDPEFGLQYAFNNTGQSIQNTKGTLNDDIHAEAAWDVTQGNGIKVAILDTGINLNHPDLAGKVIAQKSFVSATVEDGSGHGTHVAGIIAADTNNSMGVAGTCPGCQLIIGKILDDTGTGTTSNAVAGITWAADQGAKVINMSLGTTQSQTNSLYQQAVTYAMQKGAVVVAAAGNDGNTVLNYPAATSGVISVAAIDNNDKKPSWSNYGSWVQITAPGNNILSTAPTHSFDPQLEPFGYSTSFPYMYLSGTSMATPIVSGVAALVASTQYGTTPQAITNRLYATANKIAGTGTYWAQGEVDAAAAVGPAPTTVTSSPSGITPTLFCVGGAGVPPCATIPPSLVLTQPATGGGTNPSGVSTAPSSGGGNGAEPTSVPETNVSVSPSPVVSGTPSNGNNQFCANVNVSKAFYNLASTKQQSGMKIHIKCHSGGGGDGDGHNGGINPNNGWLSKFIQLLLQLLQQLLQWLTQCLNQTPGGTPTTTPSISAAPSGTAPSQTTSVSPSSGTPSGTTPSTGAPSISPTISLGPTTPITSSSCTNPTQTIQMDPNNVQNGITLDKYYLSADTWNAKGFNITQTVYVCSYNNWYVTDGNMTESGGVKTYPNVHEDFSNNPQISSFKTISSTFASTSPRAGIYDAAYDIWINNMATEVMIWNESYDNTLNGLNPPGSVQATVTLSGQSYNVYKNGNYIAFKAATPFDSGTIDLLGLFNWMISKGYIASNATLGQIDYGIEFVSTNGQNETFKVTNFSITTN